jgi:hypothetical protein
LEKISPKTLQPHCVELYIHPFFQEYHTTHTVNTEKVVVIKLLHTDRHGDTNRYMSATFIDKIMKIESKNKIYDTVY